MRAYVGITVAGLPNLFLLLGAHTGLDHHSVVFMTVPDRVPARRGAAPRPYRHRHDRAHHGGTRSALSPQWTARWPAAGATRRSGPAAPGRTGYAPAASTGSVPGGGAETARLAAARGARLGRACRRSGAPWAGCPGRCTRSARSRDVHQVLCRRFAAPDVRATRDRCRTGSWSARSPRPSWDRAHSVSVPLMEAEVPTLGRSFGTNSTEVGRERGLDRPRVAG